MAISGAVSFWRTDPMIFDRTSGVRLSITGGTVYAYRRGSRDSRRLGDASRPGPSVRHHAASGLAEVSTLGGRNRRARDAGSGMESMKGSRCDLALWLALE